MGIAIAGLAVVPYLNALSAGFTLDDLPTIRENPVVRHGIDPIGALASQVFEVVYRPFTVLTYAVNEALLPDSAAGFHAVNVLLHVAVSLAVFMLGVRLFRSTRIAVVAAALFAVHPVHTEAVTSVVGRAELLVALLGLLTLLTAVQLETARGWRRAGLLAVSLTSFCLALLSKESALTVLPLIPLFRVACRGESWGAGLWRELRGGEWIPYALCAGAFIVLRELALAGALAPNPTIRLNNVLAFVPWTMRVRSAFGVLWDYFGLLHMPLVLAADYSYSQVPVSESWFDLRFLAGLGAVGVVVLIAARHRVPAVRFAAALSLIAVSMTANVLFPIGTIKAERLLYLPSVGWALLVAYGIEQLGRDARWRGRVTAAVCVVLCLFAVRTWVRNWDWKDNTTLFRSMVSGAPWSAKARLNYGKVLDHVDGDVDGALVHYQRALDIYPLPDAALAIGTVYERKGDLETAVAWYEKALSLAPLYPSAYAHLCGALTNQGRAQLGVAACRRGLRLQPADPVLLKGVGLGLIRMGDAEKGRAVLRRALALDPHDTELHNLLNAPEAGADTGMHTSTDLSSAPELMSSQSGRVSRPGGQSQPPALPTTLAAHPLRSSREAARLTSLRHRG